MKTVQPELWWPDSWKISYQFDLQEVYGPPTDLGYHYAYWNRATRTLHAVRDLVPIGSHILDVAAAQGNFTLLLAEAGYHVTWNDLRGELADYVELKRDHGQVTYCPGDIFSLDIFGFDVVLLCEVIEHVAHPDQLLKRVAQMLRPGGYIVMTTPNGAYFRNKLPRFSDCANPAQFESQQFKPDADGHIFLLHTDEVRQIAQLAGLQITQLDIFTNPLTTGHIKLRYILPHLSKRQILRLEHATSYLPHRTRERLHSSLIAICKKPS